MRVAPIALYGIGEGRFPDIESMDMLAAEAAEITHKHPLGYIPAALMVHVIYRLAADESPTRDSFYTYTEEGLSMMDTLFPGHSTIVEYMRALVKKPLRLRLLICLITRRSNSSEEAGLVMRPWQSPCTVPPSISKIPKKQ